MVARLLPLLAFVALAGPMIFAGGSIPSGPSGLFAQTGTSELIEQGSGGLRFPYFNSGGVGSITLNGEQIPPEQWTVDPETNEVTASPDLKVGDVFEVTWSSGETETVFVLDDGSLGTAGGSTGYVPGFSEGLAPGAFELERHQRIEWARAQCVLVSSPGFNPATPGCGGFNVDALGPWPPPVLGGGPAQVPFTAVDTQDERDHSPAFIKPFDPNADMLASGPAANGSQAAALGGLRSAQLPPPPLTCDPSCGITISSTGSWVTVTGTVDAAGGVSATGRGTVAGFPNIDVSLTGTVSGSTLEGDYQFGGEGLPGDEPLIRHLVMDLSDSGILFQIVRPWYGVAVNADGDPATGAAPNGDDWRILHDPATGEVLVERYDAGCVCFQPATGLTVQQFSGDAVTVEDLVVRHSPDENPVPLGVRFQVSPELVQQMGGAVSVTVFTATPAPADVVSRTQPFDLPQGPPLDPEDGDGGQDSTRTVTLGSGFNLVGWTGATPIQDALATVAGSFSGVFVWDPIAKRFRSFNPNGPAFINDLEQLLLGDGLWINIDDPNGATWTQPDFTDARSVDLVPGLQIVVWTGPDATPIEEALAGLPGPVIQILVWDVAGQRFNTFNPLLPAALNSLRTLNHGDAFWIEVSQGVTWEQPTPGAG